MTVGRDFRVDVVTDDTDELWSRVAGVYVGAFSAPPYEEDPLELAEIADWGPDVLRSPGGGLVIARDRDDEVIGFALGRPLLADPDWQGLLVRCGTPRADSLVAAPERAFVLCELATSARARRRGVGAECLALLTEGRPESTTVLGVYAHADEARAFYLRLGFDVVGAIALRNGHELLVLAR